MDTTVELGGSLDDCQPRVLCMFLTYLRPAYVNRNTWNVDGTFAFIRVLHAYWVGHQHRVHVPRHSELT